MSPRREIETPRPEPRRWHLELVVTAEPTAAKAVQFLEAVCALAEQHADVTVARALLPPPEEGR